MPTEASNRILFATKVPYSTYASAYSFERCRVKVVELLLHMRATGDGHREGVGMARMACVPIKVGRM